MFYREGKALGLDRDDIVIRRRLRQKMEFVAEDMAVAEPNDGELAAYLASNAERFRSEDRLTFSHVYLSAARREALERDAESVAAKLASANAETDAAALGDHFLLGEEFRAMPRSDVARTFGERFAEQLFNLEQGRWQGPVASSYGLHFVLVSERTQGGLLPLDAVRPAVRREWMNARRMEAEQKLYRTLRERYEIVVEAPPAERATRKELPEPLDEAPPHASLPGGRCCSRPPRRRTKCGRAIWSCGRPRRTPTTSCSSCRRGAKNSGSRSTSACPRARRTSLRRARCSPAAPMSSGARSGATAGSPGTRSPSRDCRRPSPTCWCGCRTSPGRRTPIGSRRPGRLSSSRPRAGAGEVAVTYLRLGIEHILFGIDHLLFVLALVILVREWRRVAITVTAFTIAHSITLAAATLGFVHVPGRPVEATIACRSCSSPSRS